MKCTRCGAEIVGNFCSNCGAPAGSQPPQWNPPPAQTDVAWPQPPQAMPQGGAFVQQPAPGQNGPLAAQPAPVPPVQAASEEPSRFTGGAFANFGINFLTFLVTLITLSLAYPAMKCWQMRWEVRHTYIYGRQLTFDGKARQLYGKYLLWLFLSVITLGIYYLFCMRLNLVRWQTKHTHISGVLGGESKFTGSIWGLFSTNFVCNLVTMITLSFGMYWATCHRERWYAKHKIIDGYRIEFDGTGMQYFAKRIVWTLLTVVTLGAYSFWLAVKSKKWIIKHTIFAAGQLLPAICNGPETAPVSEKGSERAPAVPKTPRGPEYWGDLEKGFVTKRNKKNAKEIGGGRQALRIITVVFTAMVLGLLAEYVITVNYFNVYAIFGAVAVLIAVIIAFILAKTGCGKIQEDSSLLSIKRIGKMMTVWLICILLEILLFILFFFTRMSEYDFSISSEELAMYIGSVFIVFICVVMCLVARHRIRGFYKDAKKYHLSRGVPKSKLKKQPLGEFYIKLDKYNEYRRYQKYKKQGAESAPKAE